MFSKFRPAAALALTVAVAASTMMSASAVSTQKSLSSNFTLVNLVDGPNNGQIQYYKDAEHGGGQWRDPEDFDPPFTALGDQLIKRQYDDPALSSGSGSVVVSTDGPVGAVVQIQARGQTATSGAYVGVSQGAAQANVPLVSHHGTSASGPTNSQIIIQNASSTPINVDVDLINLTDGQKVHTQSFPNIPPNASKSYDLADEAALPEGWLGSAVVKSTTAGGEVAVVSNFFTGANAMLTFNAFTTAGRKWVAPLIASRLANSLSTPITVQNVSGQQIPAHEVKVKCTKDPGAAANLPATLNFDNPAAITNNASVAFNPVTDHDNFPDEWFGACTVTSGTFDTVMFVQMRFVTGNRAGAYEGILGTSTEKRVVIPLYAKNLPSNHFASAVTISNLSDTNDAHVDLVYKGAVGTPGECTRTFSNVTIAKGGSLIQNHRTEGGVPELIDGCVGTLTVTSHDQPINAFVQLDFLQQDGDPFMAHDAFIVAVP
jgi:hypothetical protein